MDIAEAVPTSYQLPGCSKIDMDAIRSRFNLYFVPQTLKLKWQFLSYSPCRDVVLFQSENRIVDEACICVKNLSKNNYIPIEQRILIADLGKILLSYQRPKEAVFSFQRHSPHLSKKFIVSVLSGLVRGNIKASASDILWPQLASSYQFLSGGFWQMRKKTLIVNFFEGGFAASYFVRTRKGNVVKGTVTIDIEIAHASFEAVFKLWVAKMLSHPLQPELAKGNFDALPSNVHPFFKSCVRKRKQIAYDAMGAPPRCVTLALKMPATGNPPRAWKNTMRWHMGQIVAEFAQLTSTDKNTIVTEFILPAMYDRGDNPIAIRDFLNQVKHAKVSSFPCSKRNGWDGLFCPIGTEACARERGIRHDPEHMTPAKIWASQPKRARVQI